MVTVLQEDVEKPAWAHLAEEPVVLDTNWEGGPRTIQVFGKQGFRTPGAQLCVGKWDEWWLMGLDFSFGFNIGRRWFVLCWFSLGPLFTPKLGGHAAMVSWKQPAKQLEFGVYRVVRVGGRFGWINNDHTLHHKKRT